MLSINKKHIYVLNKDKNSYRKPLELRIKWLYIDIEETRKKL